MLRFISYSILMIAIMSCGQDTLKENKVSSLIKPNFSYNHDLFKCTLNKNYSLIGLETFFSKNINKYMSLAQTENLKFSMFFPDKNNYNKAKNIVVKDLFLVIDKQKKK